MSFFLPSQCLTPSNSTYKIELLKVSMWYSAILFTIFFRKSKITFYPNTSTNQHDAQLRNIASIIKLITSNNITSNSIFIPSSNGGKKYFREYHFSTSFISSQTPIFIKSDAQVNEEAKIRNIARVYIYGACFPTQNTSVND